MTTAERFTFLALDLESWDDVQADGMVVGVTSDGRPLRGAAGLLDWRLAGALSRLLTAGTLTGAVGERVELSTVGRLPWPTAIVLGLGPAAQLSVDGARAALEPVLQEAAARGMAKLVVAGPGRDAGRMNAAMATAVIRQAAESVPPSLALVILEDASAIRELRPPVMRRVEDG